MIWVLRAILFLAFVVAGISAHLMRGSTNVGNKKRMIFRIIYAFSGVLLFSTLLPWDISWLVDVFYFAAAISAAVNVVILEIYKKRNVD